MNVCVWILFVGLVFRYVLEYDVLVLVGIVNVFIVSGKLVWFYILLSEMF